MRIHVLGAGAGGGFPQWNCGCPNCRGLREGTIKAAPLMQTSIAVSADDTSWFLIHASPDIRAQLLAFPPLHPRGLRDSPIAGIVLTNADLDQCLGLLTLRESQSLHVYGTEAVRHAFADENRLYRALCQTPNQITWHELKLDAPQPLLLADGTPSTLMVTAHPVPGKVPLYLEGSSPPEPGNNVALLVTEEPQGRSFAHAPCVGGRSESVDRLLHIADCLFFDGTFWSDDELRQLGVGRRLAREMAHWPLGGIDGSLRAIQQSRAARRFLIHINNTNPILRADSAERGEIDQAGIEVAFDGLEVQL
jgi:pyrroloquinoline quinone biosynthesis protein B